MNAKQTSPLVLFSAALHFLGLAWFLYFGVSQKFVGVVPAIGLFLVAISIPLMIIDAATRKTVDRTALPIWIFALALMSTPAILVYSLIHGYEARADDV